VCSDVGPAILNSFSATNPSKKPPDFSRVEEFYSRRCLGVIIALSFFLFFAKAAAAGTRATSKTLRTRQSSSTAVASDRYFEFHSGFWINMHLFLLEEALTRNGGREAAREAEFTNDSSISATLTGNEKTNWDAAVAYYRENLMDLDLVTNDRMRIVKNTLENLEDESSLRRSHLDPRLIHILDNAAPVYRAHWWAAHDRANRAWIAAVVPLADADGNSLTEKIANAYDTSWPDEPVRVDVVAYANDSGAFTTLLPTRIVISSLDPSNQKLTAEEALFHEASHALVEAVGNSMLSDFAGHHKKAPPDLLHAILYFTTGYFMRQLHPDYIPYAEGNGLWQQPGWKGFHEAIAKDWQPYLESQASLSEALSRLVSDIIASSE
jgi:hypothetical protein